MQLPTFTRLEFLRISAPFVILLCIAMTNGCTSQLPADNAENQPRHAVRATATPNSYITEQIARINNKVDVACGNFLSEEAEGIGDMLALHRAFELAYDELLTRYDQTSASSH